MNTNIEKPHVFHTLDILRGVAALAVMAFHYGGSGLLGTNLFPHGYLAVDFFFILSGFVLAFAYQARLDSGWPSRSFLTARIIRLYPLYLAGTAIGFLFSFLQDRFGRNHLGMTEMLLTLVAGLLLIPSFGLKQQSHESTIYPYNKPAWSLFFELIANVFHAFLLRRRSGAFLGATLCLTGAALIYSGHRHGSLDFGVKRADIVYGIFRVMFSYTVGLLLYRSWREGRFRLRISPLVIAALLLLTLAAPISGRFVAAYDLVVTMTLFPILVLAGAWSQPGPVFRKNFEWLGIASYAVYVLHLPIATFFSEGLRRVSHREPIHFAPWAGLACMLLSTVAALLLDRFYDAPVRAYLRRRLTARDNKPSASSVSK